MVDPEVFERVSDAFVALDTDWKYVYVNRRAGELFGRDPESLLGRHIWTEFPEGVGQPFHRAYERAMRDQEPAVIEDYYEPWDRWFENRIYPAPDGISIFFTEITGRKRAERALVEQAMVFQTISDAVLITDADGVITGWNPAAERLLGYTAAEAIGQSPAMLHLADQAPHLTQEILRAVRRDGEWGGEIRVRRKDGRERVFHTTVKLIRDAAGREAGTIGVNRDVTEESGAERALRAREEQYRLLFDGNPLPMMLFDEETLRIEAMNEAAIAQYGWSREEVVRLTVRDIRPAEQLPVFESALASASDARRIPGRHWHRRRDGTVFPVEVTACRLSVGGRPTRLAMARDVTEQVEAERARDEAHRALAAVIENSPVAIVGVDGDARVTVWNRAAAEMFGYPPEEVIGRPLPLVPAGAADAEYLRRALAGGEAFVGLEVKRRHRDGTLVDVLLSSTALTTPDGTRHSVAFMIDIRERKRLEEQLRQAQKMEAIGHLAGGVAHDFNNILAVIAGHAYFLLQEPALSAGAVRDLETIRQAVDRAASLTQQLLAFGRRQILRPAPLDVGDLLAETGRFLERVVSRDIEVAISPPPGPLWVEADRTQLQQVLINLAINARDAMPSGGVLSIACGTAELDADEAAREAVAPGAYVRLSVADTGVGIAPEIRDRIFDPFFTTKEPGRGTGLGLSTVLGIVRQSGGFLTVASTPGVATVFEVCFPRASQPREPEAAEAPPAQRGGTETILVAEDDPEIRRMLARVLSGAGYRVLGVADGREALSVREAYQGRIDLLVTDVVMPGMSGPALARRLAEEDAGLPVVFLSGYTPDEHAESTALPPEIPLLNKPIAPDVLLREVRRALGGP